MLSIASVPDISGVNSFGGGNAAKDCWFQWKTLLLVVFLCWKDLFFKHWTHGFLELFPPSLIGIVVDIWQPLSWVLSCPPHRNACRGCVEFTAAAGC